ncbi:MAG: hypothetical protein ABII21_00455 [bacterium]
MKKSKLKKSHQPKFYPFKYLKFIALATIIFFAGSLYLAFRYTTGPFATFVFLHPLSVNLIKSDVPELNAKNAAKQAAAIHLKQKPGDTKGAEKVAASAAKQAVKQTIQTFAPQTKVKPENAIDSQSSTEQKIMQFVEDTTGKSLDLNASISDAIKKAQESVVTDDFVSKAVNDAKSNIPASSGTKCGSSSKSCGGGNVPVKVGCWAATGGAPTDEEGKTLPQRSCVRCGLDASGEPTWNRDDSGGSVSGKNCSDLYKQDPSQVILPPNPPTEYTLGISQPKGGWEGTRVLEDGTIITCSAKFGCWDGGAKANCYDSDGGVVVTGGSGSGGKGRCFNGGWYETDSAYQEVSTNFDNTMKAKCEEFGKSFSGGKCGGSQEPIPESDLGIQLSDAQKQEELKKVQEAQRLAEAAEAKRLATQYSDSSCGRKLYTGEKCFPVNVKTSSGENQTKYMIVPNDLKATITTQGGNNSMERQYFAYKFGSNSGEANIPTTPKLSQDGGQFVVKASDCAGDGAKGAKVTRSGNQMGYACGNSNGTPFDYVKQLNEITAMQKAAEAKAVSSKDDTIALQNQSDNTQRDKLILAYNALKQNGISIKTIKTDNCSTSADCLDYNQYIDLIDLNDLKHQIDIHHDIVNYVNTYEQIIDNNKNAFYDRSFKNFWTGEYHTKVYCDQNKLKCIKVANGIAYNYLTVDQINTKAASLPIENFTLAPTTIVSPTKEESILTSSEELLAKYNQLEKDGYTKTFNENNQYKIGILCGDDCIKIPGRWLFNYLPASTIEEIYNKYYPTTQSVTTPTTPTPPNTTTNPVAVYPAPVTQPAPTQPGGNSSNGISLDFTVAKQNGVTTPMPGTYSKATPNGIQVLERGCGPLTVYNVKKYLGQNITVGQAYQEYNWTCTDKGCSTNVDQTLAELGARESFKKPIIDATTIKSKDGVYLYGGQVSGNEGSKINHISAFIVDNGVVYKLDSNFGSNKPEKCSDIASGSIKCGATSYRIAPADQSDGIADALYYLPGSDTQ